MVNHPNRAKAKDGLIHEIIDNDPPAQRCRLKTLTRINGEVFRVSIYLDTCYAEQSSAELAVFIPAVGFSVLLELHGHEIRACHEYHLTAPHLRDEKIQTLLFDSANHLLEIGRQIVREGAAP